jgi:hypothetical protein
MRETTFQVRIPANLLEFGFNQDKVQSLDINTSS